MFLSLLGAFANSIQTRSIDLPSDSTFAVAMRSQQQAERAEQQRIKSLVLNYDLSHDDTQEGDSPSQLILQPNHNHRNLLINKRFSSKKSNENTRPARLTDSNNPRASPEQPTTTAPLSAFAKHTSNIMKSKSSSGKPAVSHENGSKRLQAQQQSPLSTRSASIFSKINENVNDGNANVDATANAAPLRRTAVADNYAIPNASASDNNKKKKTSYADVATTALDSHSSYSQPRIDKAGSSRNNQRARKLQLSDVDW